MATETLRVARLSLVEKQGFYGIFEILSVATLCTFLIWLAQWHWSRRKLYGCAAKIHGPPWFPFIGNANYFFGDTSQILQGIIRLNAEYTSPVRVWLGHQLFFAIRTPQELEFVMNSPKCLKKEGLYRFAEPLVGKGLFTAEVEDWKRHRKIIMPTFNQKILDSFMEVFVEQSDILVKILEKEVGQGDFNAFAYVSRCTLDIICETAMGIKVNAQTQKHFYVLLANREMEIMYLRMFNIWFHFDLIFNLSPYEKEQRDICAKMHKFTGDVVKSKRDAYRKKVQEKGEKTESQTDEDEVTVPKRKAFLDLLIELAENGEKFTNEELRDEVDTFMIAGSDTTASMNSFCFMMLGMHQDVQDKVYEEIMDIFGDSDRPVSCEDLPHLKYTEMAIKETMRLFPVGPAIVRAVTDDVKMGGKIIPKGASFVLSIICTHRDPEIYPDPLRFDPLRFLPEEVAKRHPYSFVPFSGGPRNCIGPKYAMMAMKALICTVLRSYRLTTDYKSVADIKLKADLMLKPVNGYNVSVHPRLPLKK